MTMAEFYGGNREGLRTALAMFCGSHESCRECPYHSKKDLDECLAAFAESKICDKEDKE